MKIDIFNHIFPKIYFDKMMEVAPKVGNEEAYLPSRTKA